MGFHLWIEEFIMNLVYPSALAQSGVCLIDGIDELTVVTGEAERGGAEILQTRNLQVGDAHLPDGPAQLVVSPNIVGARMGGHVQQCLLCGEVCLVFGVPAPLGGYDICHVALLEEYALRVTGQRIELFVYLTAFHGYDGKTVLFHWHLAVKQSFDADRCFRLYG